MPQQRLNPSQLSTTSEIDYVADSDQMFGQSLCETGNNKARRSNMSPIPDSSYIATGVWSEVHTWDGNEYNVGSNSSREVDMLAVSSSVHWQPITRSGYVRVVIMFTEPVP